MMQAWCKLLVATVAPERPAVDKLLAKKVLVPDIKAAEDLDFWPFTASAAAGAVVAESLLHAPHQPSDMTPTELIVLSIRRREPKAREPVAAIAVQIILKQNLVLTGTNQMSNLYINDANLVQTVCKY